MDFASILYKTSIGQEEVARKSGQLTHNERRILILADGRRSIGELDKFVRPGEITPIVERLMRGRFVQMVERPVPAEGPITLSGPTLAPAEPPPPVEDKAGPSTISPPEVRGAMATQDLPVAGLTQQIRRFEEAVKEADALWTEVPAYTGSLQQLKERAAEELLARCGYLAEVLAARIMTCSTPKALRALLREIEEDITEHLGTEAALEFVKRIGTQAVQLS